MKLRYLSIIILTLSTFTTTIAQTWQTLGDTVFSTNGSRSIGVYVDNENIPYVSLQHFFAVIIKKFAGNNWITVGATGQLVFAPLSTAFPAVAIDTLGTPYVFYQDYTDTFKAQVIKYDGNNWVGVGDSGFSAGPIMAPYITIDNRGIPYVSYQNLVDNSITVMKYVDSAWLSVGNPGFSGAAQAYSQVAVDSSGTPYAAFEDSASYKVTVMKYTGTAWVVVGERGFSTGYVNENLPEAFVLRVNRTGTPYVLYDVFDSGYFTTKVAYYDGNNWLTIDSNGLAAFYGHDLAIDRSGLVYAAGADSISGQATVFKLAGNRWVTEGNRRFSPGAASVISIANDNSGTTYVALDEDSALAYSFTDTSNCVTTHTDTFVSITCGDSINFAGNYYKLSGNYNDTLTASLGCDSIIILQLTVVGGDTTYLSDNICANQPEPFNGGYIDTTGTYTAHYTSSGNCDSTVIFQLTVYPVATSDTFVSFVCGFSIDFNGNIYSLTGTYTDTLTGSNGCDSVARLHLTVGYDTVNTTGVVCNGDSFNFYGRWLHTTGTYDTVLIGNHTCDTLLILTLSPANTLPITNISDTICANDSLLFNGIYIDTAGTYTAHYDAGTGCDSVVVLHLTVNPLPAVTLSWDSMFAKNFLALLENTSSFKFDTGSCTDMGQFISCCPPFMPLSGGLPLGGFYSGIGVVNDTLFQDSSFYARLYRVGYSFIDTITYQVIDNNGCSNRISDTAFFAVCEGIQTLNDYSLFTIYPNPADDYTLIAISPNAIGSTMKLFDVTGKELLTVKLTETPQRLPLTNLPAGVYMVEVATGEERGVKMLVKTE